MDSILDTFKNDPNYDPNLSFDKIVKDWEMNFLGNGKHNESFNYSLETDDSFSNAVKDNKQNILKGLFDSQFMNYSNTKFTCISKDVMYMYDSDKRNKEIKSKNSWTLMRSCDCVNKPFFRFILKPNLSENDVEHLLYLLSDCSFEVSMGGSQMLKLDKFLFNFLICQKLGHPIKTINVKDFLEQYTMDEIKSMIVNKQNENIASMNQKYYFHDKNAVYLDLPLLLDFYSYNMSTILIAMQYHEVRYVLDIPQHKLNLINKYVDEIILMFEEVTYGDTSFRRKLATNAYELIKINSTINYWPNLSENKIEFEPKMPYMKFIFVILRQEFVIDQGRDGFKYFDSDIDVTQFPQIIDIEITIPKKSKGVNSYCAINGYYTKNIALENIWLTQYNNMVIYGIAVDGHSNMNNWVRVSNECIESTDKLNLFSGGDSGSSIGNLGLDIKQSVNNLNLENYQEKFSMEHIDKIKILFSDSSVSVNVEVIEIHHNLQRIMSGMTGEAFTN
jgi:hypothetical protein